MFTFIILNNEGGKDNEKGPNDPCGQMHWMPQLRAGLLFFS
jgi:hypothetical protein